MWKVWKVVNCFDELNSCSGLCRWCLWILGTGGFRRAAPLRMIFTIVLNYLYFCSFGECSGAAGICSFRRFESRDRPVLSAGDVLSLEFYCLLIVFVSYGNLADVLLRWMPFWSQPDVFLLWPEGAVRAKSVVVGRESNCRLLGSWTEASPAPPLTGPKCVWGNALSDADVLLSTNICKTEHTGTCLDQVVGLGATVTPLGFGLVLV